LWQTDEKSNAAEVKEANVAVYRDQLRELQAELQNSIVSKEQYDQDREEIERRLLQDIEQTPASPKKSKPAITDRNLAYTVGALLPLIAVAFYLPLAYQNERDRVRPPEAAPAAAAPAAPNASGTMSQEAIQ